MPPFVNPFNPATPTDASLVSQGDDEFRSLKAALKERMETLVTDFDDGEDVDGTQKLVLRDEAIEGFLQISSGTLAARPNPPTKDNLLYVAEDTDQAFISKPDGLSFAWQELKPTAEAAEVGIVVISAGESRFAPDDDESHATRVKNAIATAKLSSAEVKVVYVPKSFWGYVEDADYDSAMYDNTVQLVREGGITGWYDPIAYGADPTGDVNSFVPVDTCFDHAAAAALGGTNAPIGMKVVAFTIPGIYTINTDVDQRSCGVIMMTGVTLGGTGELIGARDFLLPNEGKFPVVTTGTLPATGAENGKAYFVSSTGEIKIWDTSLTPDGYTTFQRRNFKAYGYTVGGAAAAEVAIDKELFLKLNGTSAGTSLVLNWATAGLETDYPLAKLHTLVVRQYHRAGTTAGDTGADGFGVALDVAGGTITLSGLATTEAHEFGIYAVFTP
jgi:hypothetical protein